MSRLRSNCSAIFVVPRLLVEVNSFTPAIRANWRSRGVATVAAIVSGLAPGRAAVTEMAGNSTCGNGDTGKTLKASAPANATAMVSSVVATGRWMNADEIFMPPQDGDNRCADALALARRAAQKR